MPTNALILSGGGARAAYQVGVLTAINEILPSSVHNPFPIICGTSAGAINALALATHTGNYSEAVKDLNELWCKLRTEHVFKTHWWDLLRGFGRLGLSLFHDGVGREQSIALLDNSPLREVLSQTIDFSKLQTSFDSGDLKAVSITAMNYSSSESISFFQSANPIDDWSYHRRKGIVAELTLDHLMASSAIPAVFPAAKIGNSYYGDGALRQLAPISPALHLGAERILVIGVSNNRNPKSWRKPPPVRHPPSIGQVGGHLFNSAFVDSLEGDLAHLERINKLLKLIPEDVRQENNLKLKPVESLVISPSQPIDKIAGRNVRYLPKSVRVFMRSMGATAKGGGATTSSYILFEERFIDELIELGHSDAMWQRDKIKAFFNL